MIGRSASFVIGRRGQERGGAIVGDGPFEFYASDLGQHASSSSSSLPLGQLLLAGGWRSLGLIVSTEAHTGGLSLGSRGLELGLLLLEQLLFLLLGQLLLLDQLLLILIVLM